jgi:geranylgeranyl pyrophosphate synthase
MLKPVDEGLAAIESKLIDVVSTDVDLLQDVSHHNVGSGGEVISLAAAVELAHAATRVHDDINAYNLTQLSNITAKARRGRMITLLTGDYFFGKVYELMAPYGAPYNMIMANACTKLVEGETLQAAAAKAGKIDQATYYEIIARKTASLFEAAALMGATLAAGNEDVIIALSDFAYNLGLTFQIMADITTISGDQQFPDKTLDRDPAPNGKSISDGIITANAEADLLKKMIARLRDTNAVELALAQATEFGQRSREALIPVPDSPRRTELVQLVDSLFDRTL